MRWKTFKEELPEFDKPIFVYKEIGGLYSLFKYNDDIRKCQYIKKSQTVNGSFYYLKGYDYREIETGFKESEFMKMKWMEIPKP